MGIKNKAGRPRVSGREDVSFEFLPRDGGKPIEAELTRERYLELALKAGESAFLTPRKLRVFVDDYSI